MKHETITLKSIRSNPFRNLERYAYDENKIATLQASFDQVGMWDGIVVRRVGNGFEQAFGHHRVEAARRSGYEDIDVTVMDLDDDTMLQMMANENMEDYNSDFLVLLETWEAAVKRARRAAQNPQPLEIAKFLGWVRSEKGNKFRMKDMAIACSTALQLIENGDAKHDQFKGLAVKPVLQIVTATAQTLKFIDNGAKLAGHPPKKTEKAKKAALSGTDEALKGLQEGTMSSSEAKAKPHSAMMSDRTVQNDPVMFNVGIGKIWSSIAKTIKSDAISRHLEEVKDALRDPDILRGPEVEKELGVLKDALRRLSDRALREIEALDAAAMKEAVAVDLKVISSD